MDCRAALFDRHQMGDHPLEVVTRAAGYSVRIANDAYGLMYLWSGDRKIRPRVGLCALAKRDARKCVLDVH